LYSCGILFGLVVLYVLGVGPATVLSYRLGGWDIVVPDNGCPTVVEGIGLAYQPLWIISEKTKTSKLMGSYLRWWVFTAQPKKGYPIRYGHVFFDNLGSPQFVESGGKNPSPRSEWGRGNRQGETSPEP
jgi:hypothetical protein